MVAAITYGAGKRLSMAQQLVRCTAAVCGAVDGDVGQTDVAGVFHYHHISASEVATWHRQSSIHNRDAGCCGYTAGTVKCCTCWLLGGF